MMKYLVTLKAQETDHQTNLGDDAGTVFGWLYNACCEYNGMDNDEIKQNFEDIYEVMRGKTPREKDWDIDTVCCLYRVHYQTGFTNGLQRGIHLV